jgi:hypothetical protein
MPVRIASTSPDDRVTGKYSVKSPEFEKQRYGIEKGKKTFSFQLCLSSTTKRLWGKWDFIDYTGYLRSIEPYHPGKKLHFEIRGMENGESETFCNQDEADSWIKVNEEDQTIEGCIDQIVWESESFSFNGRKVAGKPVTVAHCKKQFRSNNEWNESKRCSNHGWDWMGGSASAEAAYESDTTQESDVEDVRKKVNEAQDKRAAEREARRAEKASGKDSQNERGNRRKGTQAEEIGNSDSDKENNDGRRKDSGKRKNDNESEPIDVDDDDDDDDDADEITSWIIPRPETMILEEEAEDFPFEEGKYTYGLDGLKALGHKELKPDELIKLVKEEDTRKTGLLQLLRAQLALYGLPDRKSIKAAKETILEAYEKNHLKKDCDAELRNYNMRTKFEMLMTYASIAKAEKLVQQRHKEKGGHKPSCTATLIRVGRQRAKRAVIEALRQEEEGVTSAAAKRARVE